jgi:hypothetical protein
MEKESKKEKFKRIAVRRTNEILEKIRLLGNCANKRSYDYTDSEINKIFFEIEKELKIAKIKFQEKKGKTFEL